MSFDEEQAYNKQASLPYRQLTSRPPSSHSISRPFRETLRSRNRSADYAQESRSTSRLQQESRSTSRLQQESRSTSRLQQESRSTSRMQQDFRIASRPSSRNQQQFRQISRPSSRNEVELRPSSRQVRMAPRPSSRPPSRVLSRQASREEVAMRSLSRNQARSRSRNYYEAEEVYLAVEPRSDQVGEGDHAVFTSRVRSTAPYRGSFPSTTNFLFL